MITIKAIRRIVEQSQGIHDLTIRSRKGDLPIIRGMFMQLACEFTSETLYNIAKEVKRDHSTVIYWRDNLKDIIAFDGRLKAIYQDLKEQVYQQKTFDFSLYNDEQAEEILELMSA